MNGEQLDKSNKLLAEIIAAGLKTKQLHWTMRGRNFIPIHRYFDEVHEFLGNSADGLAERMVMIGGLPDGSPQAAVDVDAEVLIKYHTPNQAILSILEDLHEITEFAHEIALDMDDDLVSQDLLIEMTRGLDKIIWLLESEANA